MARFTFTYKKSDGTRNVGTINAKSKEKVFETLRREGIKPIKVERADTLLYKTWQKLVSIILPIVLTSIVAYVIVDLKNGGIIPPTHSERRKYEDLGRFIGQTDVILQEHKEEYQKCSNDFVKAQSIIELTRSRLRITFRDFSKSIEQDSLSRQRAELHYGRLTALLDEQEISLEE